MRRRRSSRRSAGSGPLLVRDDAWAPGLVGLVAGRLADSLARPVAAATLVGDEVRGSVRAPTDFHVAAALEACAALLTKRGGHAAAGGFSLLPESWAEFSAAFAALPRPFPADAAAEAERPGPSVVDLVLPARLPRLDARRRARPPRAVRAGPRRAGPGGHRHGAHRGAPRRRRRSSTSPSGCAEGLETFDAIAFGLEPERPLPEPGDEVDLVGTLERDDFGGMPRLRLRVVDFAHRSSSPLVARRLPPVAGPGGMSGTALERLRARRAAVGSPLCLGIDPHPDALPEGLPPTVEGIETFARGLIEAAAPHACAVKINVAFFEAFGSAGWAALERTRADVPARRPLHPRREARRHRTTAERYAAALFGHLDADAVTLSPYLGEDADRAVPRDAGPARLRPGPHEQPVGRPLPGARGRRRAGPPAGRALGRGALDGWPRRPRRWRDRSRRAGATARGGPGPGFLVPGVGAQGGDLARPRARPTGAWAPGLVNVSRASRWRRAARTGGRPRRRPHRSIRRSLAEAVLHSTASPVRTAKIGGI